MPNVERSALVHHSAEQMFDLVADIDAYPQFLPWCAGAQVIADPAGGVDASIDLAYLGIRTRFTTRNVHRYPEQIGMSLLDGPFRSLVGQWNFRPLRAGASKVQLSLNYEFANGMLGAAIAPVFNSIASSLVDAFVERAEALYGPIE